MYRLTFHSYDLFPTGNWLFCTKKPPKTEEEGHESTHHQRAHIKINRMEMFSENGALKDLSIDISMDDKAYLRPGTDGMFEKLYLCGSVYCSI